MNDYLWDKKGRDDDVAALEDALRPFRVDTGRPPQVQTGYAYSFSRAWRRFFFGAAIPSLATIMIAAFWFGSVFEQSVPEPSEVAAVRIGERIQPQPESDKIVQKESKSPVINESGAQRSKPNLKRRSQPRKRAKKAIKKKVEEKVVLTSEEQFAYAELMKALQITSSKLKLVKDKVSIPNDSKGTR